MVEITVENIGDIYLFRLTLSKEESVLDFDISMSILLLKVLWLYSHNLTLPFFKKKKKKKRHMITRYFVIEQYT